MTNPASTLPSFETPRLEIRPIELKHAPSYTRNFVDYEVIRHLGAGVPWPYPEKGVEEYIQNEILPKQGKGYWAWGLFLKNQPEEMIGGITLWTPGIPENRGFWLGRNYWGLGLMTEANFPIIRYAFDVLGFEKLILSNALGNLRSRKIKERSGAVLIGTREFRFVDPQYTQSEIWELTPKNWNRNPDSTGWKP